jgi:23S rRNA (cytidine1920-2'-O)/16S rRNA (cytidine1409-2'-O)-methyltransferase
MRDRLDTRLVALGLSPSREKAKRLILAGAVRVKGQVASKPSDLVDENASIEVQANEKYVSRGGHKLEAALDAFSVDCAGKVCADIGASTGGFTDCLLQRGAARVHAIDVGKGQLDWKLRNDPRVIIHDDMNARHIQPSDLREPVDIVTVDASFISLTLILPAAVKLLNPAGILIALIKPQFEAGPKDLRKGVVRDTTVHDRVINVIRAFATVQLALRVLGVIPSPLLGPAGNRELLIGLTPASA